MVEQLVIIDSGHVDYTAIIHARDSSSKFYITSESVAAVDCDSVKAKPKNRMAALRAAILFLGFMSSLLGIKKTNPIRFLKSQNGYTIL